MKKMYVIILTLSLSTTLVAGIVYNYTFNSKHRNIADEAAAITLSANELFTQFQQDESLATANNLDKVIEIRGKITSVEANEITLDDKISANLNTEIMPKVVHGISITIKGRCVGYDELLEVVKIDQAIIINNEN